MVKVVITGGLGFLGRQIARSILARGRIFSPVRGEDAAVSSVTLFDLSDSVTETARAQQESSASRPRGEDLSMVLDPRVDIVLGSISSDTGLAAQLVDTDDVSVFHLASMMSGNSEDAFDDAWAVNVEGQRSLLEALRARSSTPRFMFSSSVGLLGGDAARHDAHDLCKLLPENTYGYTKAVCELMLNEYTRRGFVDGRGVRLPSIVVRPGLPNAATTSVYSGVVREPLAGVDCALPLPLDLGHPVASYEVAVEAFVKLMEIDPAHLDGDRIYNLPSISVTLGELVDSVKRLAEEHPEAIPPGALGSWIEKPDERLTTIVEGMPSKTNGARALALGIRQDIGIDDMVAAYARDMMQVGV